MNDQRPPVTSGIELHCIGVRFRDVGEDVRRELSLTAEDVTSALRRLATTAPGVEGVILATCNRVEIYLAHAGNDEALAAWHRTVGHAPADDRCPAAAAHRFHLRGEAAARHLFEVAAGLDSDVLGDVEIVGQIRRARSSASAAGTVGAIFHRLFDVASRVGRRSRAETAIASGGASLGASVVRALADRAAPVGAKVVLLGAGDAASSIARELSRATAVDLVVLNRTPAHAAELAVRVDARAGGLDRLLAEIGDADVVVSAVGGGVVVDESLRLLVSGLRGDDGPIFLDTAVGGSIERLGRDDPNLVSLDDLTTIVDEVRNHREGAVEDVCRIVDEELTSLHEWLRTLALDRMIAAVFAEAEAITRLASRFLDDDDARRSMRRRVRREAHRTANEMRMQLTDAGASDAPTPWKESAR